MMLVSFLFLLFFFILFFFNDTATTEIYTLSLHDVFRSSFLVSKENRTFRRRLRDAADLPPADLFARMCNCAEISEPPASAPARAARGDKRRGLRAAGHKSGIPGVRSTRRKRRAFQASPARFDAPDSTRCNGRREQFGRCSARFPV